MSKGVRLIHYLYFGVIGAVLFYIANYVLSVLILFGGEIYGDDIMLWVCGLGPLSLITGAIFGGAALKHPPNVPTGGGPIWWLGRPVWTKILVAVVAVVAAVLFYSHISYLFNLPTFWSNSWGNF